VKLVDANVLLYAVHAEARHHTTAVAWLDRALSSVEAVALPWISLVAFLRISTHPAIYPSPLTVDEAFDYVFGWQSSPVALSIEPDRQHVRRLRELLAETGSAGNLVNDAHVAALALQYDATVVTYDNDFGRFAGVRWERPGPAAS
jgi:toxin-antitoxin system PIN domain toxin